MYETFDHTADLGLRVRADDLNSLFAEAAEALFSAVVEDLESVKGEQTIEIRLHEEELELLLFDWLNELLYRFDVDGMLFRRFAASIDGDTLTAIAYGEPIDRNRHALTHEVKAITYHGLRVEQENGSWLAEVIVDI